MSDLGLWFKLYIFRILIAACTFSSNHPDEIWQFHEPAHVTVFGLGHLTWDWRARIRSFLFPLPLIVSFYFAKWLGDKGFKEAEDLIVQISPIFIKAFWASVTDLYTYKLARKYFGPLSTKWALLLTLSSPAQAQIGTRSFSNSFEAAMCAVVAFLWPANRKEWNRSKWMITLIILGLTCLIRISAIQMFLPAAFFLFLYAPSPLEIILTTLPLIAAVLGLGILVDSYFYGELTLSWWNFFQWNVLQNVSSFFGVEPVSYYLETLKSELLFTSIPFLALGLFFALKNRKSLFPFFAFVLPYFIFSCIQPHKEHRFLLPILPICLVYAAHGGQQLEIFLLKKQDIFKFIAKFVLFVFVLFNSWHIVMSISLKFVGAGNAIQDLRNRVKNIKSLDFDGPKGIFALLNCHHFPNYGNFHLDYPLTFISCPPPFSHHFFKDDPDAQDQMMMSALFYGKMIEETLEHFLTSSDNPPAYLVINGYNYLDKVEGFDNLGYKACGRHINFIMDKYEGRDSSFNDIYILCNKQNKFF